jgi:hypothetical protein
MCTCVLDLTRVVRNQLGNGCSVHGKKNIEHEGQEQVLTQKHSMTSVLKKMSQLCLDPQISNTETRLHTVETSF